MSQPPPPPPPHGENPRTTAGGSGLPPGKYDVFIIPEHSAGAGFLYLPSLKPQWNSFIAGVVSTLAVVIMLNLASPMIMSMFSSPDRMWSFLWMTLLACVGAAAFLFGRHQNESSGQQQGSNGGGPGGYQQPRGGYGGAGSSWYAPPPQSGPPPNQTPPPPPPPPPQQEHREGGGQYQSWNEQPRQQPQPEPQAHTQPPPPPPPQPEPQAQAKPEPKPKPQEPKREEPKEEPKPKPKPPPEPKQQSQAPPPKTEAPKGAWEKAREEMRRREEERKAKEAEAKKKEDTARRLRELREREAKERERREREARERDAKEKLRQEQEAKERERLEREVREKVEKELREKAEREAKEREAREREAKEREARLKEEARKREEERARQEKERQAARERERKEREERLARLRKEQEEREKAKQQNERKGTAYAYSSVGEKTSMWPNGAPPSVAPSQAASTPPPSKPSPAQRAPSPAKPTPTPSPTKPAPSPTKSTASATGTEDTYSYRPYDKPKKPTARKKSVSDFSESSWAPSASTARTTPPPSTRGPYTTNDPQKIVIKAVYGYLNQFSKTPASQLISGVSPVTDGLILRITSAGLFVDDDVRGVAQREWDIKAWTLKLVEVWCPVHAISGQAGNTPGSVPTNHPFFKTMPQSARRAGAERGATKTMLGEEAVAYIDEFGRVCDGNCRRRHGAAGSAASGGDEVGKGLHLLRATIRDQEGKRYLFVIGEEEAWKIAGGLAALRGSSQVRALGVAGFSGMESRTLLDTLGWGA